MVFAPHAVVISRAFLYAFPRTSYVYLKLRIILFLVYVHSDCLFGQKKTRNFALNVASPAIVSNCVAHMRKAFNNTLLWDWIVLDFI